MNQENSSGATLLYEGNNINRATVSESYHSDKGSHAIEIHISPSPKEFGRENAQPWIGHVLIKSNEVPRLMREGLHFNEENVVKEEGYIDFLETAESVGRDGATFLMTRHYFLTDLRLPPRWTANLKIYANAVCILHNFRLDQLSRDMIDAVWAWGVSGKAIYHFDAMNPHVCFNAIYDDMPLEGWWPWPRRDKRNGVNGLKADEDTLVSLV